MTTLEWDLAVGSALAECAVARGGSRDDIEGDVYLRKLEDLDAELVRRALDAFALERRKEFESVIPSVGAIRSRCEELARQDAEQAAARKLLPMPASEADPRTLYFCLDCHDESSGWREMFCHGASTSKDPNARPYRLQIPTYYCGRKHGHVPHYYVERCACYETNPVIAKRRAAQSRPQKEARP